MQTCAIIPIDDPSPIAFDNLYDEGDRWVKIQGCEACPPERAKRCCTRCPQRMEKGCAWHFEPGQHKAKPLSCVIVPVPTMALSGCVLIYTCVQGRYSGWQRRVTDRGNVLYRDGTTMVI